jgi:hypothetical protein
MNSEIHITTPSYRRWPKSILFPAALLLVLGIFLATGPQLIGDRSLPTWLAVLPLFSAFGLLLKQIWGIRLARVTFFLGYVYAAIFLVGIWSASGPQHTKVLFILGTLLVVGLFAISSSLLSSRSTTEKIE